MAFPPLPQINGQQDIFLDIVTHRSLQRQTESSPDYGDTDRLRVLGEHAMGMVVAHHLFSRHPLLSAGDMQDKHKELLSVHNYRIWVQHYKLRVLAAPGVEPLEDGEEVIRFFNTYVGAVYHRNGLNEVMSWILGLFNPYDPAANMNNPNQDGADSSTSPPSYQSHGSQSPNFQPYQAHGQFHSGSSPPAEPAPPPPNGVPPPMPNGVSSLITLAVVNQTAAQRGLTVSYEPDPPIGPAHSPIWTVRCMINGTERGRGQGKNQKLAKEEAAKQAWVNMGF